MRPFPVGGEKVGSGSTVDSGVVLPRSAFDAVRVVFEEPSNCLAERLGSLKDSSAPCALPLAALARASESLSPWRGPDGNRRRMTACRAARRCVGGRVNSRVGLKLCAPDFCSRGFNSCARGLVMCQFEILLSWRRERDQHDSASSGPCARDDPRSGPGVPDDPHSNPGAPRALRAPRALDVRRSLHRIGGDSHTNNSPDQPSHSGKSRARPFRSGSSDPEGLPRPKDPESQGLPSGGSDRRSISLVTLGNHAPARAAVARPSRPRSVTTRGDPGRAMATLAVAASTTRAKTEVMTPIRARAARPMNQHIFGSVEPQASGRGKRLLHAVPVSP
jgi:hypothetical protein